MQFVLLFVAVSAAFTEGRAFENPNETADDIVSRATRPYAPCTAIQPSPKGHICGTRGSYHGQRMSYENNHQHAANLASCIELFGRNQFRAIGFNETSGLCTAYHDYIGTKGGKLKSNPQSDSIFYDILCFDCPLVQCPLPAGVNLLQDPGFELSSKYFGPWDASYLNEANSTPPISIVAPGSNSARALHLASFASTIALGQPAESCADDLYSITFDYLVPDAPSGNASYLQLQFDDNSSTNLSKAPTGGAWRTYRDLYIDVYGVDTELTFNAVNDPDSPGRTPEVYLDNFNLSSVAAAPLRAAPGATSVVTNGGFESGRLAPWVYTDTSVQHGLNNSFAIVSPGLDGTAHAFRFSNADTNTHDGISATFTLTQSIAVVAGTGYLFGLDVAGQGDNPQLRIGERMYKFAQNAPNDAKRTVRYKAAFIAQSDSVDIEVFSSYYSDDGPASLLVDNISVLELS